MLGLALGLVTPVMADPLTIEITQGVEEALPIAIVPFATEGTRNPPENIAKIISDDLKRTGRFKPFPIKDMLSQPTQPTDIKFQNWRVLGVENLVIGNVRYLGAERYEVNFWLYDVFKAKQLPSFRVPGSETTLRATAHKISDVIYEQLLGEPGAFSTSIAYVTAKMKNGERHYSLWMADADGANAESLLNSRQPIMSPAWAPDGKRIAYASLEQGGKQKIFVQEWASGRRQEIKVPRPGLMGAPAWSRDGKKLAFTITYNGNAEIYVLDLVSNKLRQLTHHWAIDTEAAWMPDGKSIIFTSDRGGRPQLYKMSANGGSVKRLTFDGQENARASISPDGKMATIKLQ
jgi:TolB protein